MGAGKGLVNIMLSTRLENNINSIPFLVSMDELEAKNEGSESSYMPPQETNSFTQHIQRQKPNKRQIEPLKQ